MSADSSVHLSRVGTYPPRMKRLLALTMMNRRQYRRTNRGLQNVTLPNENGPGRQVVCVCVCVLGIGSSHKRGERTSVGVIKACTTRV